MNTKITPFLWFDNQAEAAATFYCSVFKNAKIVSANPMLTTFELEGQRFTALNGGPQFNFTEAVSFMVECDDQGEVDYFWDKLIAGGGAPSQCAWLKDKYGLSWQIVPKQLPQLLSQPDRDAAGRVMQAMLKMQKIDIAALQQASAG